MNLYALAAALLASAACTFPDPEILDAATSSTSDGGHDATAERSMPDGALLDGPADTRRDQSTCTPHPSCYAQAATCSSGCATTENTCVMGVPCSLEPTCVASCEDAGASCKKGCAAECALCTAADGGCIDVSGCDTASGDL